MRGNLDDFFRITNVSFLLVMNNQFAQIYHKSKYCLHYDISKKIQKYDILVVLVILFLNINISSNVSKSNFDIYIFVMSNGNALFYILRFQKFYENIIHNIRNLAYSYFSNNISYKILPMCRKLF